MEVHRMTKVEVKEKIIDNLRFTACKYFWEGNQLMSRTKQQNIFGPGFYEVELPVILTWKGLPVEVRKE